MTVHSFNADFARYHRNAASKNPRKLQISTRRDRLMAAICLRNARVQAQTLRVSGYDRHLLMAGVHASLMGEDHVARMFVLAALD